MGDRGREETRWERGKGRAARVGNGIQEKVEERHGGDAVKTKRCKKWHRK